MKRMDQILAQSFKDLIHIILVNTTKKSLPCLLSHPGSFCLIKANLKPKISDWVKTLLSCNFGYDWGYFEPSTRGSFQTFANLASSVDPSRVRSPKDKIQILSLEKEKLASRFWCGITRMFPSWPRFFLVITRLWWIIRYYWRLKYWTVNLPKKVID